MSKSTQQITTINQIKTRCQQIIDHPSQINNLNSIFQSYIEMTVLPSDADIYEQKLNAFSEICKVVQGFIKKAKQSKNNVLLNFLEQKIKLIVEIFVGSELKTALKQEDEFQIVVDNVADILMLIYEISPEVLSASFVEKIIFNSADNQEKIDVKSFVTLFQTFTKASFIQSLLVTLNKELDNRQSNSISKKSLQSISAFFINLPPFDQIEFPTSKSSQKLAQKSFQQELQQDKPKLQFKKVFQSTFLKALPLIDERKEIAVGLYRKLDSRILSKMNNPLILSNYFLDKFKQEPQIQIQVLSCLFILVGKYGLEFENFYPQLQHLIKQKKDGKSVFQMKNSKRFFKLVESALRSSKVPFKTIQSMTKIIISQIFQEQSEFAFWALSFFFNLAKKHRKLLDIVKEIPELPLMLKHYNPKIRSLVNELKKDLNKAEYLDIEKFSKIDCKKLTEKKVQQLCAKLCQQDEAEFKIPGLFQQL